MKKLTNKVYIFLIAGLTVLLLIVFLLNDRNNPNGQDMLSKQLVSKCKPSDSAIKPISSSILLDPDEKPEVTSTDFKFEFPYSDWKFDANLAEQFEESIKFPRVLHSRYFSYPEENKYPMFIDKNNEMLVVFTVSQDYCVSVEEWASKIHFIENYTTKIQKVNSSNWFMAENKKSLPLHQMAFVHHNGYHYELNFYARDYDIYMKNKDLITDIINSFKFL